MRAHIFEHTTTYGTRWFKLGVGCNRARRGLSNDVQVAIGSSAGRQRAKYGAAHKVRARKFSRVRKNQLGVSVVPCSSLGQTRFRGRFEKVLDQGFLTRR
jgi:hypothetical protein